MRTTRLSSTIILSLALGYVAEGAAQAQAPKSLDALLKEVKSGNAQQRQELKRREAEFRRERAEQAKLLSDAEKKLRAAEKRGKELEQRFRENEVKLGELEQTLKERLGTMNELFGVVRQVSADAAEQVRTSLVSADKPGRVEKLTELGASTKLPSIDELRHLWFAIQEEMTETGKVTRFNATVVDASGTDVQQEAIRVGGFNVVSGDGFLEYKPEVGKLFVLGRQPPDRYLSTALNLMAAQPGQEMVRFSIDPSRGAILGLLVEAPTLEERLALGGTVGYVILGLGAFALLIGIVRFIGLTLTGLKVGRQQRSQQANPDNPLGRVLKVYEENRQVPVEDLERKLDEVIVRESGRVERFIWVVKVVAGAAPLMGLLGTVTGMIRTFQAITLFGAGDPRLMAGGISEALVTTMLGLVVAVPLVLMHAILSNSSKRILDIIEEQAAGVVARRAESEEARG